MDGKSEAAQLNEHFLHVFYFLKLLFKWFVIDRCVPVAAVRAIQRAAITRDIQFERTTTIDGTNSMQTFRDLNELNSPIAAAAAAALTTLTSMIHSIGVLEIKRTGIPGNSYR